MNIAVSAVRAGAAELKNELAGLDAAARDFSEQALRLHMQTLDFLFKAGIPAGLVGDALGYFGQIHAGIGQTTRGLQGLHAAAHEAEKRLLAPTEERSGPGDKTPPPKP